MAEIKCTFCDRMSQSAEAACNTGWIPSYWDCKTETEIGAPVCPHCCETKLQWKSHMESWRLWDRPVDEFDAQIRVTESARQLTILSDNATQADILQSDARIEWERLKTIADGLAIDRDNEIICLRDVMIDLDKYME